VNATVAHDKPCEECGTTFTAKTPRAKFCGTACRVRANRRPSKTGASATDQPTKAAVPERGGLVGQVAADLVRLGVLDTIPGRAALALAYRIESPMETGSAAASMTREMSRLVEDARALTPRSQDGIDQIGDSVGAKLRLVK